MNISHWDRGWPGHLGSRPWPRRLSRRRFLVDAGLGLGTLAVRGASEGPGRELIQDPSFRRGLNACRPAPGRHDRYGVLEGFEALPPAWDLVQWSSREAIPIAPNRTDAEVRTWSNRYKSVQLGAGSGSGTAGELVLAVNGWEEYGERARRDGEPWVHLLVEQFFENPPALSELTGARFRISVRLLHSRLRRTADYSTGRHAAQFQVFLTLQNRNPGSTGHGKFLWFGIPLYDDRHRVPPAHKTQDTAGSGMFIYTPSGDSYAETSAHDGSWLQVDREILPMLREALETAWKQGFLVESRKADDYRITGINLGWEVPGILDVSMAVKGLGLRATTKGPSPG